jgi:hypothetical protein
LSRHKKARFAKKGGIDMEILRGQTEFGVEVAMFCARYGFSRRRIAERLGIPYVTLRETASGRTAGHEVKPKVREFMKEYENSHQQGAVDSSTV